MTGKPSSRASWRRRGRAGVPHLQQAGFDLQLWQPGVPARIGHGRRQRGKAREQVGGRCKDGLRDQHQLRARLLQRLYHLVVHPTTLSFQAAGLARDSPSLPQDCIFKLAPRRSPILEPSTGESCHFPRALEITRVSSAECRL